MMRVKMDNEDSINSEGIQIGTGRPMDTHEAYDIAAAVSGDGEAYRRLVQRYQQEIAHQMYRFSREPEFTTSSTIKSFFAFVTARASSAPILFLSNVS